MGNSFFNRYYLPNRNRPVGGFCRVYTQLRTALSLSVKGMEFGGGVTSAASSSSVSEASPATMLGVLHSISSEKTSDRERFLRLQSCADLDLFTNKSDKAFVDIGSGVAAVTERCQRTFSPKNKNSNETLAHSHISFTPSVDNRQYKEHIIAYTHFIAVCLFHI